MKIPFGTITINQETKDLVNKALDSGRVSSGKYVGEFEKQFAKLVNARQAVAVSSGTDADILALAALYDFGVERGEDVIVPSLSFVATGNAVLHAGLNPVFVDIDYKTLNIDEKKIESAITKKTKAIMPVHLMGKPAKMDVIMDIAKKHNLFVIEDAAEAHGAVYKGKKVGEWGDMAAYSLYIAHIITTVEGGVVTSNREDFAEILRSLRCHGRACKCETCVVNISNGYCEKRFANGKDIRFIFERVGYSSKMNELEAAVGIASLNMYHGIIEKRHSNLVAMIERLREFSEYLDTIEEEKDEKIGPHAFPIIVKKGAPFTRNELVGHLEKNGIDTRDLFSSMPTQCPGFKFLGHKLGDFPVAEFMGTNGLHIGVHQDIRQEQIDYIMVMIRDFVKEKIR
ncbi:MAG: DegT/DnrJ/EryC1/StrS family aminotransferase [Candidatus Aceula meridiana]|nr:DegT/DnrJ/EryC1/StrS family aminotransferase [Candidatus Aceula meridiana]